MANILSRGLPSALLSWMLMLAADDLHAADSADGNVARGVLHAKQEAVLSSTLSARILDMPYREGERFAAGATLVSFDCARLAAELRAAQAGTAAEARNVQVQSELLGMGATGRADADIAVLKERERRAQAQAIQQQMAGCKLVAPYAGRVVETLVRTNETPAANERLIHIVSDGQMELHMVVPSRWLAWLERGATFDFAVDETGDQVQARVDRVAAAVDPVSQTIKIVSTVAEVPPRVLPGMSGQTRWAEPGASSASLVSGQVDSTP